MVQLGNYQHPGVVRTLLNVIWFIFSGFWLWLAYMLAGVICCLLIVTIPWGIASFRMAAFALWPFGKTIVAKPTAGLGSAIGNVIWFVVAGVWLAIGHLLTEGLLHGADEVATLMHCTDLDESGSPTFNVVDVTLAPGVVLHRAPRERTEAMTSACGVCGSASVDAVRTNSRYAVASVCASSRPT